MPLREELRDLMSPDWGAQTRAEQYAWGRSAMRTLLAASASQEAGYSIAGFLSALQVRGAQGGHLAGFASALREAGASIHFDAPGLTDTCGTGGGVPSLNISTGAALLAAGAGAKIAKHGNRGVTSSCGSADVLEALGVAVAPSDDKIKAGMDKAGFAFLFAPRFYEVLKAVGPIRRGLAVRTVFNQLGPLLNPAGAKRQMIGVYDESLILPTAEALAMGGCERGIVAHGTDGLDELSPCGPSRVAWVESGQPGLQVQEVENESLFGLQPAPVESLAPAANAQEAAAKIWTGLTDPQSVEFRALQPSAAMAVHLSLGKPLAECAHMVLEAAASGRAGRVVELLRKETSG